MRQNEKKKLAILILMLTAIIVFIIAILVFHSSKHDQRHKVSDHQSQTYMIPINNHHITS